MQRLVLIALLLTAGCAEELTPEDRAKQEERDIALVKKGNSTVPPLHKVVPEPILYPDIERHDLTGPGCKYAPGTSFGTRVIARPSDAFIRIEDEIIRLAADPGARELAFGTRSFYVGRAYELRLDLERDGEELDPSAIAFEGSMDFDGTVSLRDQYGRTVYEGSGLAQCSN